MVVGMEECVVLLRDAKAYLLQLLQLLSDNLIIVGIGLYSTQYMFFVATISTFTPQTAMRVVRLDHTFFEGN